MKPLTFEEFKADFAELMCRVIKHREVVVFRTANGYAQIMPYNPPARVPVARRGSLGRFTRAQYRLLNTVGESL